MLEYGDIHSKLLCILRHLTLSNLSFSLLLYWNTGNSATTWCPSHQKTCQLCPGAQPCNVFRFFWWRYRRRICRLDLCTYVQDSFDVGRCLVTSTTFSVSYKSCVATLICERFFQCQWAIHWIHSKSIGQWVTQSFWYPWVMSPDPLCNCWSTNGAICVLIRRGSSDNSSRHRSLFDDMFVRFFSTFICTAYLLADLLLCILKCL